MAKEKKINENASSGSTSAGAVASVSQPLGSTLHYPLDREIGKIHFNFPKVDNIYQGQDEVLKPKQKKGKKKK